MGSLPDDTRCAYCDAELAGYIPDSAVGAVGPACMGLSPEAMVQMRLHRRAKNWRNVAKGPGSAQDARATASHLHWFRGLLEIGALGEHVALYCINA